MTTFSNKVLYTKGYLDYHVITVKGNQTDTDITFNFKEPIKNVVSMEVVQGIIKSGTTDAWIYVRCPEMERRLEGKINTGINTPLALINANVPYALPHTHRYFSKPRDSLSFVNILLEIASPENGTLSLNGPWILEIELISIRVATHTDWRKIPQVDSNKEGATFDKVHDALEQKEPDEIVVVAKEEPKKKKEKFTTPKKAKPVPAESSLGSTLLTGTVGALGLGTAVALGVKFK